MQLQNGWHLYTLDNSDFLPPNLWDGLDEWLGQLETGPYASWGIAKCNQLKRTATIFGFCCKRSTPVGRPLVTRRVGAPFAGPVELPQAAAEGFDLLLIGVLLPLGQFQRFQYLLHVVQGVAERVNNVIDLLNGLLNAGQSGRRWLPTGGWDDGFLFDGRRFSGGLCLLGGLRREGRGLRSLALGRALSPTSAPAATAPATSSCGRRASGLGGGAAWVRLLFRIHVFLKVP